MAATIRNFKNSPRNSSLAEELLESGALPKTETKRTMRSAEAVRRWIWKRGARVLKKRAPNWRGDGDFERRIEISLSFLMCVAFEALTSSRILAIFCINCLSSSLNSISLISYPMLGRKCLKVNEVLHFCVFSNRTAWRFGFLTLFLNSSGGLSGIFMVGLD